MFTQKRKGHVVAAPNREEPTRHAAPAHVPQQTMAAFLPLLLVATAGIAIASQTQDLQLRLMSPVASYSRPGTPFTARVIGAQTSLTPILPTGTVVRGVVRKGQSVGLGLRRERAELMLEFNGCQLPTGASIACDVSLLAVDNARETVHKDNRIQGALAASHPQSLFSGLWYRPAPSILLRPVTGLVGTGGMLCKRVVPGPLGAGIFIVSRLIFFRMPDPEIELPAGTDLIARVGLAEADDETAGSAGPAAPDQPQLALSNHLAEWLAAKTTGQIGKPDGTPMADMINLAFLGSATELSAAFAAAGWDTTDLLSRKTFMRTYKAFTGMKSYARAPVSALHYDGKPPDFVFQKSFNTLARRHHIRLWKKEGPGGETVWLGAATHDVGVAFDWNRLSPTHRIDLDIDLERTKVVNDLLAANCLAGALNIERSNEIGPRRQQSQRPTTDGAIIAASLRACQAAGVGAAPGLIKPRHSALAIGLRRVALETRYYLLRGNAYYFAYQSIRWIAPNRHRLGKGKNTEYANGATLNRSRPAQLWRSTSQSFTANSAGSPLGTSGAADPMLFPNTR